MTNAPVQTTQTNSKAPVSCVIHTYNSQIYLESVLQSVSWCAEIIIIDMHSQDSTLEIAKRAGAKIYMHQNLGYADPARQFGLEKCTHDWILALDSDEIVPKLLAKKLQELTCPNSAIGKQFEIFYLHFRNYFFGRELRGSGWGFADISVPRFFKKGFLTYESEVHNFIRLHPKAHSFHICEYDLALIHFNYNSVHHFIYKLNKYTDLEAQKNSIKKLNPSFGMIYHFLREFFGRFLIKHGYRDGWVGLYLSFAMAFYRMSGIAKANLPSESVCLNKYSEIAKNEMT